MKKQYIILPILMLVVLVGVAFAQTAAAPILGATPSAAATPATLDFKFPEIMVTLLNLIVVPLVVQALKKISPTKEIRAIIAGGLSFVTAIVGLIIAQQFDWGNLTKMLVLAYSISQLAYNLFWYRVLQNGNGAAAKPK